MLLTNGYYYVFLIAIFFAYWFITRKYSWRVFFLALASYFFYSQSGILPVILLWVISSIDFFTTQQMAKTESLTKRKLLLATSLTIDLGTLCVFKYANFFMESATSGLSFLGLHLSLPHLNLIVPMGISFFIFQSVAFVIDVYRRDVEPTKNYFEHLAYISFFPTLIAGPILRAKQFLPQLREKTVLTNELGGQALFLILFGLLKKIAVADYLATNFVDRVFDFPERFSALEVLMAIYGYALQIYMDFSGYSDIAIGSALLLGITLPLNFNLPYRSRDLAEFWRRWHISLSTWLRDYVFFSIAGARVRSTMLLYVGLVATMLIGGLWHGATWTFVFWGLLHGIGLVVLRVWETLRKKHKALAFNGTWWQIASTFITFHFICFTWIFFKAETLSQAIAVLHQLTTFTFDHSNLAWPIAMLIVLGLAVHYLPETIWEKLEQGFVSLPAPLQASVIFLVSLGLYYVASSDVVPFIYAQF
jgi:D-alanyl-lipoteichoic acid acyltransferase DltB (MBOAT superfamily)